MGSPEGEAGRDTRETQHDVTLSPFLIAKYEVSQSAWKDVTGGYRPIFEGDNFPAKRLSWEDCQRFCRRTGLRIPSEAQWERACRAGTTGPYASTGELDEIGWYKGNSKVIGGGDKRNPVGKKKPNGFGLYDMHGSIEEWCEDIFDHEFYSKPGATQKDPVCTSGSEYRVYRGGKWIDDPDECRSAYRRAGLPSDHQHHIGFRPAYYPLP